MEFDKENDSMYFKPKYGLRKYGFVAAKNYVCPVTGCRLDCGDQDTLVRHIKREHPEVCVCWEEDAYGLSDSPS